MSVPEETSCLALKRRSALLARFTRNNCRSSLRKQRFAKEKEKDERGGTAVGPPSASPGREAPVQHRQTKTLHINQRLARLILSRLSPRPPPSLSSNGGVRTAAPPPIPLRFDVVLDIMLQLQ